MWHVTCGPTFSQSGGAREDRNRLFKKHFLPCKRWGLRKTGSTNGLFYMTTRVQGSVHLETVQNSHKNQIFEVA